MKYIFKKNSSPQYKTHVQGFIAKNDLKNCIMSRAPHPSGLSVTKRPNMPGLACQTNIICSPLKKCNWHTDKCVIYRFQTFRKIAQVEKLRNVQNRSPKWLLDY